MTPKPNHHAGRRLGSLLTLLMLATTAAEAAKAKPKTDPDPEIPNVDQWLENTLAGPLAGIDEIVFAVHTIKPEHWYANIGYFSDRRDVPTYGDGGRLCKFNLRTKQLTTLIDDPKGNLRDPCVHYDGQRIVFSWRKGGQENYLLYEIRADGTGLRQLTHGEYDDYEPCWTPDDGILFVSTRCRRWVNCWLTQVGNIHRCDADGSNVRPLSANLEQDNTPWMLPDGRALYMRWEYVDRSQVLFHHLWTMNPDGTGQTVFFGNLHPGGVFIDAKPIPGGEDVVLIHSPGHGQTEHAGNVAVVSAKRGPDERSAMRGITRAGGYRDPWAFSSNLFMAARDSHLYLINEKGETALLLELPKDFGPGVWLHEPRPIMKRNREAAIAPRVDATANTGRFFLDNVYFGRNMDGVQPGEIKKLLVVESLPKPVNFTGGMDPLSYKGTFTIERVLGEVPVEADGSAYFEAPALRSLFFVALDAHGRAVKRMQSFTTVQPGETLGCLGCHEHRTAARPAGGPSTSAAVRRGLAAIEPIPGVPQPIDFPRDIQPILDRHCVKCHNPDRPDGRVVLTGDRGPMFSLSFYALTAWLQIADGRNDSYGNRGPHQFGSGGSPVMEKLERKHYDVAASPEEKRLVGLWLDAGASYPGTYAALATGMIGGYQKNQQVLNNDAKWPETEAAAKTLADRCDACHKTLKRAIPHSLSDEIGLSFWTPDMHDPRLKHNRHVVFNLTRPEKSLVLMAPLAQSAGGLGLCRAADANKDAPGGVLASKDDPAYRAILAMCEAGKRKLDEVKRFDMPGFKPRPEWVREMKRYGVLPDAFDLDKDPIDVYAVERKYWELFELKSK